MAPETRSSDARRHFNPRSTKSASRQLTLLCTLSTIAMLSSPTVTAIEGPQASFPPSAIMFAHRSDLVSFTHCVSFTPHTTRIAAILSHPGFQELAKAAPSLSDSTSLPTISAPGRCLTPMSDSIIGHSSIAVGDLEEALDVAVFKNAIFSIMKKLSISLSMVSNLQPHAIITRHHRVDQRSVFRSSDSIMAPNLTSRPPGENIPTVNGKVHCPTQEPTDATSHSYAASPFKQAAHPPKPDEPNSQDNLMIHTPEGSRVSAAPQFGREVLSPEPNESSTLETPMIRTTEASHFPANKTVSSANVFVLPPVVSQALTPTSKSISAPLLEFSKAEETSLLVLQKEDTRTATDNGVMISNSATGKGSNRTPRTVQHTCTGDENAAIGLSEHGFNTACIAKLFPTRSRTKVPRVGPKRELKFAPESFWGGKSSAEDLIRVVADLNAAGASGIQFVEPTPVLDLDSHKLHASTEAYSELEFSLSRLNVLISYLADIFADAYKSLTSLKGVTAYGFTLVRGTQTLNLIKAIGGIVGKDKLFSPPPARCCSCN